MIFTSHNLTILATKDQKKTKENHRIQQAVYTMANCNHQRCWIHEHAIWRFPKLKWIPSRHHGFQYYSLVICYSLLLKMAHRNHKNS